MQQLFTLPGWHLLQFKARRSALPFCPSHSNLRSSCVCVVYLYLARAKENISIWPENQRSKAFTFYTTSPINCMGYGKRLAAMLSEKRDSHTANDGMDVMPLELCLLRSSILCLSGARPSANMPGNAAVCEPIDLQSERPIMNAVTFSTTFWRYIYINSNC